MSEIFTIDLLLGQHSSAKPNHDRNRSEKNKDDEADKHRTRFRSFDYGAQEKIQRPTISVLLKLFIGVSLHVRNALHRFFCNNIALRQLILCVLGPATNLPTDDGHHEHDHWNHREHEE